MHAEDWSRDTPIFWEHEGNATIRLGQWKLVCEQGKEWELYDMEEDRTELTDLANKDRTTVKRLERLYTERANNVGIRAWAELMAALKAAWGVETVDWGVILSPRVGFQGFSGM